MYNKTSQNRQQASWTHKLAFAVGHYKLKVDVMNKEPNFEEYSYENLLFAYRNVDEREYPERKELIEKLIDERKDSAEAIAFREAYAKEDKSPGCLGFVIGVLSFIPLIGVVFGLVAIIWGITVKNTKLKVVGSLGIVFTIVFYSSLGYLGFVQEDGVYDELRQKMAKSQIYSAIQAIEFYKVQNGSYPNSLKVLQESLPENSFVFLFDPTQIDTTEGAYYFYELQGDNKYHIRALGRDGVFNTEDDVLPDPMDNTGLVVDYLR